MHPKFRWRLNAEYFCYYLTQSETLALSPVNYLLLLFLYTTHNLPLDLSDFASLEKKLSHTRLSKFLFVFLRIDYMYLTTEVAY